MLVQVLPPLAWLIGWRLVASDRSDVECRACQSVDALEPESRIGKISAHILRRYSPSLTPYYPCHRQLSPSMQTLQIDADMCIL